KLRRLRAALGRMGKNPHSAALRARTRATFVAAAASSAVLPLAAHERTPNSGKRTRAGSKRRIIFAADELFAGGGRGVLQCAARGFHRDVASSVSASRPNFRTHHARSNAAAHGVVAVGARNLPEPEYSRRPALGRG